MRHELQHALNPAATRPFGRGRWALAAVTLAVGMLGSAGCQSQTGAKVPVAAAPPVAHIAPTPPGLPRTEIAVRQQINDLIGKAACDAPAHCKTLGLGSTPCGGPEAWVAWSTKDPAAARLPALAEELAALQRSRHEVSGMRSICRYLPDPGASCTAGQCVVQTPSTAN